jgi:hypothetical protein
MYLASDEKFVSKILGLGASITTLFLITGSATDPVNAPKLFLLGGIAFSLLAIMIGRRGGNFFQENKILVVSVGVFFVASVTATLASDSPLTQNLYGTYGRNTGLVAYVSLALILMAASGLRTKKAFQTIVLGLLFAGAVNVLYSAYVLSFSDPVNWENPYGALLGTLGNPNFISSFLGFFIATCVSIVLNSELSSPKRLIALAAVGLAFFEISFTDSIQGYVVTFACSAFVIYLKIRSSRFKSLSWPYLGAFGVAGTISVAGVFKLGPLTGYLYQGTMAFREQYWKAAINMGTAHPFTGVGMDAYGDNYRSARELRALTTPGVQVVSNSAHNVVVEFFASGGYLLLISYLTIVILSLISVFKFISRSKKFDPIFATLSAVWLGYQLQSLISINQIGLAVWGWLLTGAVIGYERATREKPDSIGGGTDSKKKSSKDKHNSVFSVNFFAGIGALFGFLIAVPPLSADMAWANAAKSGNYLNVQTALTPGYMKPMSSARLVQVIQMLENSKLNDQAREFALKAVEYNPNSFDSWLALYSIQKSTPDDKRLALQNLKRLDPLNPDVTKL